MPSNQDQAPSYIKVSTPVGFFVVMIIAGTIAGAATQGLLWLPAGYLASVILAASILAAALLLSNLQKAQRHQTDLLHSAIKKSEKASRTRDELLLWQAYAEATASLSQMEQGTSDATQDQEAIERLRSIVSQLANRIDAAAEAAVQTPQATHLERLLKASIDTLNFASQKIDQFPSDRLRGSETARQEFQEMCRQIAGRFRRLAASEIWDAELKERLAFENLADLVSQFQLFAEYPKIEPAMFRDPQTGQLKQEHSPEIEDYLTAREATIEELTEWRDQVMGVAEAEGLA